MIYALVSLFTLAFLAATILPLSSEAMLFGFAKTYEDYVWLFFLFACLGNILGSVINWILGRWLIRFKNHRFFPVKPESLAKAEDRFQRWGWPSLLLSWVPIIGDPLTLVAGLMRYNIFKFILLVSIAKSARYLIVILTTNIVMG
ncbi:MAG: YqaA family protein [Alphaproteobacteria bacterium]|nr:YqaA family protein [Alphaproteobacteria bacterium]